jgi:hypothetical protein
MGFSFLFSVFARSLGHLARALTPGSSRIIHWHTNECIRMNIPDDSPAGTASYREMQAEKAG